MIIFLASWAMMFGSLFFSYGVLRLRLTAWPPPGAPALPLALPLLNTAVLLASSLAAERSLRLAGASLGSALARRWLQLALLLGLVFVALQLELWRSLLQGGLTWGRGTMAGVVYGLTTFHAAHVLVGLAGLGAVWGGAQPRLITWRLWTTYWHFVSVVWLVMFLVLFTV
jgi:heme/copper-type cytochrome/quinol oxidase subunit 3